MVDGGEKCSVNMCSIRLSVVYRMCSDYIVCEKHHRQEKSCLSLIFISHIKSKGTSRKTKKPLFLQKYADMTNHGWLIGKLYIKI